MACYLRSFSRRNLSTKWLCFKNSRPVLGHTKDFSESSLLDSSLYYRKVLSEERKSRMSFVQPVRIFGVLLSKHMSSSRPEDLSEKIDVLGSVVEEPMVTKVSSIDECTTAIENFAFPEDCVKYVINGIHELTGLNWWMSIVVTSVLVSVLMSPVSTRVIVHHQRLRILSRSYLRVIQTYGLKSLTEDKIWNPEFMKVLEKHCLSFYKFLIVDAFIYISFIKGISAMAKNIPGFENGGILWFTNLSTQDSSYVLPLVTVFTFWWTQEIIISKTDTISIMKRLSWFTFQIFALQATFELESAVYLYMIPSRIYIATLNLMLKHQKLVKFRSLLGLAWPNGQVKTVRENQMSRLFSLLKKYKKD